MCVCEHIPWHSTVLMCLEQRMRKASFHSPQSMKDVFMAAMKFILYLCQRTNQNGVSPGEVMELKACSGRHRMVREDFYKRQHLTAQLGQERT